MNHEQQNIVIHDRGLALGFSDDCRRHFDRLTSLARSQRGRRPRAFHDLEPGRKRPLVGDTAGLGNQTAGGLWKASVCNFPDEV